MTKTLERNDCRTVEELRRYIKELTDRIRAARLAGDWDEHLRLWEERRMADVDADEAIL